MAERTILLETIEPVALLGANNVNFDVIKSYFPKVKLVSRGNEIKVIGDTPAIMAFEDKMLEIVRFIKSYNSLNTTDIERIMIGGQANISTENQGADGILLYGNNGKPIKVRTANQQEFVNIYNENDLIFAIGPAGTGKTYVSIALAVRAFRNREVKRIILTRPAVEAGEHLGFLPGDLKEKLDPYMQPLYDALNDMIPGKRLTELIEEKTIQIAPLAFMRGRTLSNAFVILDEAQNATVNQLKMFLTRMGENSKFIVTGDITQIDLPNKKNSGLLLSSNILKNVKGIGYINFGAKDIIRHRLVKDIVEAYETSEALTNIT